MATLFFRKPKHKMTCLIKIRKSESGDELACCYIGVRYFNQAFGISYEQLPESLRGKFTFSGYLPDQEEWFFGYDIKVKTDIVPIKHLIVDLDAIANKLAEFQS